MGGSVRFVRWSWGDVLVSGVVYFNFLYWFLDREGLEPVLTFSSVSGGPLLFSDGGLNRSAIFPPRLVLKNLGARGIWEAPGVDQGFVFLSFLTKFFRFKEVELTSDFLLDGIEISRIFIFLLLIQENHLWDGVQ
ncbi:hypothetical protein NPIL_24121, partial [Nephila pilipes]